ncbi:uncharacterized protein CC84DRAFT_1166488 [Paraphaeosphaeria sporulosa]|uniref:Letm1 RBD domain-containing protein n=1 Tax=Paraphaeosphaeria sporulosa TaxID=1460663 RepID=A0A177C564_9PLEO|nr:uncharacterized protein CC84DRAFT_1166488 [Paraphaeosphaeria sporulosa]OAG02655.1 hypothetical protein CC84DRAFT_1166488 [Paraphaeosphaeria sporulosa]
MKPRPILHFTPPTPRSICPAFTAQCHRPLSYARTAPSSNEPQSFSQPRGKSIHNAFALRPHMRFASTAAVAATASRKPSTSSPSKSTKIAVSPRSTPFTAPVPQVRAKLNPPPETYPPDLQLPPRGPELYVKYLYRCGRSYITFYKQGVSNVRATLKLAKTLRAKASSQTPDKDKWHTVLTRAEWQVVNRSGNDRLRLPAFAALLVVFGEWLPLLVVYLTPVVPEPCRIPYQLERSLKSAEKRRQERERRLAIDAARLVARDRKPGVSSPGVIRPQTVDLEALDRADLFTLLSLDARFGVQPRVWDWLFLTPPKALLRWGLKRRIGYLQKDDEAIRRDGGFQALEVREVQRACVERGIRVLGRKEGELRKELAGWFER